MCGKNCVNTTLTIVACLIVIFCINCTSFAAEKDGVLWNLQNADLSAVIEEVSQQTGKNFLIDPRVKGKVNVVSSQPLDEKDVYQVFLSMLQVLGYTAVESGEVTKIVPIHEARHTSTAVRSGQEPGSGDEMVVQVIPVHNVKANRLVPILRPLVPENGNIAAYDGANTLIISSSAANVKRLATIIHDVDKADTSGFEVIPLHQTTAADVAEVLHNLLGPAGQNGEGVRLAADDHTNSLLISGDQTLRWRARALISQLDSPAPAGSTGNTQVIHLHYQKAKELAPILMKMLEQSEEAETKTKSNNRATIEAEPAANALIITAPPTTMTNLKRVITQLDQRPAQVLVEAAIVEVNDATLAEMGVLWGQLIEAGTRIDFNDMVTTKNGLPSGFNPGIFVIKNGNLREVIHLFSRDSAADILSTPSVMVMDNQEAKIEVGKTLSIETGSYASSNGVSSSVQPFNTFQRDNIGLHLYVTPQINRGDTVQLSIDQGNETLQNPLEVSTSPVTNKTSLQTTVLVRTGDILVLGGLISNNVTDSDSKIPLAGDIPLIGRLFHVHGKRMEKKNLMIFIKPTIIKNSRSAMSVTDEKYNFIRNEQILWETRPEQRLMGPEQRILPMWQPQGPALPKPFISSSSSKPTRH